jgi:hypothetical protein
VQAVVCRSLACLSTDEANRARALANGARERRS